MVEITPSPACDPVTLLMVPGEQVGVIVFSSMAGNLPRAELRAHTAPDMGNSSVLVLHGKAGLVWENGHRDSSQHFHKLAPLLLLYERGMGILSPNNGHANGKTDLSPLVWRFPGYPQMMKSWRESIFSSAPFKKGEMCQDDLALQNPPGCLVPLQHQG